MEHTKINWKLIIGIIIGASMILTFAKLFQPGYTYTSFNVPESAQTQNENGTSLKIGQPFVFNDIEYTVAQFDEVKEYHGQKTDGKFIIATIEAKNKGDKAVSISDQNFILLDQSNRQFKSDGMRDISTEDNYFSLTDSINPGIKKIGKVSFEVPDDTKQLRLGIRDNIFDLGGAKYKYVDLKK